MRLLLPLSFIFFLSCAVDTKVESQEEAEIIPYDSHVHLMSPELIAYWKEIGIPFSKSEANYANLDTILDRNGAQFIDLIGMGYVYGNPEYYQGDDVRKRISKENDYLLETARKHKERVRPFFSVDPLRDFAIQELDRCYAINPNGGLKLHFNASQVYLTEPVHLAKVKQVFKWVAERELPVLLHFDNWHPKFGKPDIELLVDSILAEVGPFHLRIAHFGTSGGFNEKTKRFLDAFLAVKAKNTQADLQHIYFDISAVALDKDSEGVSKLTEAEFTELASYVRKIGVEQIIFGTDYPLYTSGAYLKVLHEKVGLTEHELEVLMKNER